MGNAMSSACQGGDAAHVQVTYIYLSFCVMLVHRRNPQPQRNIKHLTMHHLVFLRQRRREVASEAAPMDKGRLGNILRCSSLAARAGLRHNGQMPVPAAVASNRPCLCNRRCGAARCVATTNYAGDVQRSGQNSQSAWTLTQHG